MVSQLKKIKKLYKKNEFWSKVNQSLYPIFPLFQSPMRWAKVFPNFLKECDYIESRKGFVIRTTQETTYAFFDRLVYTLHIKEEITNEDLNNFLSLLREETSEWDAPKNPVAQQIIFKAMLEIGLKRKKETLTVFHLIECPIFETLPSSVVPDLYENPIEFMFDKTKFKKSPDFHIISASKIAKYEYVRAIQLLSSKYLDMEKAYNDLRKKSVREDYEERFIKGYLEVIEMP